MRHYLLTRRSKNVQRGLHHCELGVGTAHRGRGLCGPCTPQQGYHPCTRCATYNRIKQNCFRMLIEETKGNSTTGVMKTKKKTGRESKLSPPVFSRFPRMQCIRLAAFRRRPVCASGTSNSQTYNLILLRGFCVFLGGETTIPQALRASSLYTREPFLLVSAGKYLTNKSRRFRYWVQGRCPCWGEGATPLMGSQASAGDNGLDTPSNFRPLGVRLFSF